MCHLQAEHARNGPATWSLLPGPRLRQASPSAIAWKQSSKPIATQQLFLEFSDNRTSSEKDSNANPMASQSSQPSRGLHHTGANCI